MALAVVVGAMLTIWRLFTWNHQDSVTVYGRSCEQANTVSATCTSWNLVKTNYYINRSNQQVFFEGRYGPMPLSGCHVVNEDYWYCDGGDKSGYTNQNDIVGYKNGVIVEDTPSSRMWTTEHFGVLTYWWYIWISKIRQWQ